LKHRDRTSSQLPVLAPYSARFFTWLTETCP